MEQEWLEEDSHQLEMEKQGLLDFLRGGWQGEEANGFHRYLEEQQHEEAMAWRKDLSEKRVHLEEEARTTRAEMHDMRPNKPPCERSGTNESNRHCRTQWLSSRITKQ